jgi:mannose/fructose/N-acetylgalactosamine-specific phosphotransferase system component IID
LFIKKNKKPITHVKYSVKINIQAFRENIRRKNIIMKKINVDITYKYSKRIIKKLTNYTKNNNSIRMMNSRKQYFKKNPMTNNIIRNLNLSIKRRKQLITNIDNSVKRNIQEIIQERVIDIKEIKLHTSAVRNNPK